MAEKTLNPVVLAIDQGTTSSRAIAFDAQTDIASLHQSEFPQIFPANGWVEHDPEAIWSSTLDVSRRAAFEADSKGATIVAIGITNQRETTLVWDKETGRPLHNAIVWQDRRTASHCEELKSDGAEPMVRERTGLMLDPYFSATKLAWILDAVDGARGLAESGRLAFGTVDTFLLWRLTGGRVHATDATNASRTSLYNIRTGEWDDELLRLFNIPRSVLPDVRDSNGDFGLTEPSIFGRPIPIRGIVGDQQAASIGQACFSDGDIKSTFGTGCFVLLNTGGSLLQSQNRLLSTVAYQIDGNVTYALEGSVFVAGAGVQWLRDGLGLIKNASETEGLSRGLQSNNGVYIVPAFTGLGAPYWRADARGAIFGLSRGTGPAELARAMVESVCYQTNDLLKAMADDGANPTVLKVDGGMIANSWMCEFLAGILNCPVDRPVVKETTALGAAYLAGMGVGVFGGLDEIKKGWRLERRFEPDMPDRQREDCLAGWKRATSAALSF